MFIRRAADLGALVRDKRKTAGLTQGDLARRLNTSARWVSELERGKPTAELEMALRALNALGIPLSVAEAFPASAGKVEANQPQNQKLKEVRHRIDVNDLVDD